MQYNTHEFILDVVHTSRTLSWVNSHIHVPRKCEDSGWKTSVTVPGYQRKTPSLPKICSEFKPDPFDLMIILRTLHALDEFQLVFVQKPAEFRKMHDVSKK